MNKWKKCRRIKRFLFLLSCGLCYAPLLAFIICGFMGKTEKEKIVLAVMVVCAVVLLVIESKTHHSYKGVFSLIILGGYITIDNISAHLLAMMICSVVDDIIVYPLYFYYKDKFKKLDQAKAVDEYGRDK